MIELNEKQIIDQLGITKPVLMLDTVKIDDISIAGEYHAKRSYPYWECHFVDNPVMPGTLMVEMLAQAGALLEKTVKNSDSVPIIISITKSRFLREVKPDSILKCDVRIVNSNGIYFTSSGKIINDGKTVCKVEMVHAVK